MAEKRTPTPLRLLGDADFRRELKDTPASGYLFFGEEDYLKAAAVATARETLGGDETLACFNVVLLDGMTVTPDELRRAYEPLPMMADRKLILLRGLDFSSKKANEIEDFLDAFEALKEYEYNTLLVVAAAGTLDEGYLPKKPSALLQKLSHVLTLVRYERCTPARLVGWCVRHFAHNGVTASSAICEQLIQRCGRDMYILSGEIEKAGFYVLSHGRTEVTAEDIQNATASSTEFDGFALAGALTDRQPARALEIVADMKFRRVEPLFALSEVIRVISELLSVSVLLTEGKTAQEIAACLHLHEFKVGLYCKSPMIRAQDRLRRLLEACMQADGAMKLSAKGYAPLEQWICTL